MKAKNHPLLIYALVVVIFVFIPITVFISIFSPLTFGIRAFDSFKETTLEKYTYIDKINYSLYPTVSRNSNCCVNIRIKNNLIWNNIKNIFIDTKDFMFSDAAQEDLQTYAMPRVFRKTSYSVSIKFTSTKDKTQYIKVDRLYSGWQYKDYKGKVYRISKDGELNSDLK